MFIFSQSPLFTLHNNIGLIPYVHLNRIPCSIRRRRRLWRLLGYPFHLFPQTFFCEEAIFSLAVAVGKPLQMDVGKKNKSRPSCARVKIKVDLLGEFPKWINTDIKQEDGEVLEKWIPIKYDYVTKYCTICSIQRHDED